MPGADDRNFSGEDLVRVVVLRNGCWFQGWKMQSVELFRDGIVIRAWRSGEWAGRDDSDNWEVEDELGTSYVWVGSGEDLDRASTRLGQEFVPGVPATARLLTIKGRRETIQVDLHAAPES
jgi:hypothetical protein